MYDAALCDITLKDSSLFASVSLSQSLTSITAVTAIILCVSSVQINTYDSNVIKICANVSHCDLKIKFGFARQRYVKETMQLKPFNYLKIMRTVIIVIIVL